MFLMGNYIKIIAQKVSSISTQFISNSTVVFKLFNLNNTNPYF